MTYGSLTGPLARRPALAAEPVSGQVNRRQLRRLTYTAILVPLAWIVGVDFLFPFVVLAVVGLRASRLSAFEILGFALGLWLTFALLITAPDNMERSLSSLYSILIIFGAMALHVVTRTLLRDVSYDTLLGFMRALYVPLFRYTIVFVILGLFLAFALGNLRISFPTVLGAILPFSPPGIAERSMIAEITRPDWGFGHFSVPRPLVFAPWYTAGALTVACAGLMAMVCAVMRGDTKSRELLLEAVLCVVLFLTLSRTIFGFYLIGFALASLVFRDWSRLTLALVGLGVLLLALVGPLSEFSVLEFRDYSTETRFRALELGLLVAFEQSPLFGYGVKPLYEGLSIPVGSHSSIVSITVRGGLVALLLFVIFFYAIPAWFWVRRLGRLTRKRHRQRRIAALCLRFQILIWGWAVFQEIDTAAIASSLLLMTLAVIWRVIDQIDRPFDGSDEPAQIS
ncbi:MAG: O-antigen ligase family protein [Pseudomonadota bacterium]